MSLEYNSSSHLLNRNFIYLLMVSKFPKTKNVLYLVRLLERAQALLISLLHGMNGQILIFVLLLVEQPHIECTIVFSQLQLVLESRQVEQCLRTEFGNDKAQGTRDDTGKWTIRSINVNMCG